MVDLAGEQGLSFLGDLSVGDVDRHAADPRHAAGAVEAWRGGSDAPADVAAGPLDAEFVLRRLAVLEQMLEGFLQPLPVFRMDERADVFRGDAEMLAVDAKNAV